ncbi:class I SAM-dependent DNA methyltransferase [Actinoplanes auranticolor]|uniref:Methyltransferase n=1 Tax=Actinoplanes auranticolor TaxID=47988 RepID=A0A919SXQ4_9ACTN|nr:class I SAM-dependent methyltransferase [Actinoplanes auranticolor]GIM80270.1 methyltransferase [Actinoplanes auranticolor]
MTERTTPDNSRRRSEAVDLSRAGRLRDTYDKIARAYDARLADELDHKPLDRALLAAFVELAGPGRIADVGCGPGHVTRFLAARHPDVTGLDLSPEMIATARERAPEIPFTVASMLSLPVADGAWAGAVAMYSIIHLSPPERAAAFGELARALRDGGRLLVSFHVEAPDVPAGGTTHLTSWFGADVDVDVHFLDPDVVRGDLVAAGFEIESTMLRAPLDPAEFPSRRAYLLARRSR